MLMYRFVRVLFALLLASAIVCPTASRAGDCFRAMAVPAQLPSVLRVEFELGCNDRESVPRQLVDVRFRMHRLALGMRVCAARPTESQAVNQA